MSKPKTFRPWNPEQTLLLPPSPIDWLPENHLVFFLRDLATELDLGVIYAVYDQRDSRGVKAYEPRMMVALLLYAYCVGLPSSRRIERACWEDAAAAPGRRRQNPHGSQAPQQEWFQELRPAQSDRGPSEQTDQGGPWPAAFPAARH